MTGCETPLAWYLAKRLDELGFAVFAGFTKRTGSNEADVLKEEGSGRMKILPLDVTSETQVKWKIFYFYFVDFLYRNVYYIKYREVDAI